MENFETGKHLEQKLKEAALYDEHGLHGEAKKIYENLLCEESLNADHIVLIRELLKKTEERFSEIENGKSPVPSMDELAHIRGSWGMEENMETIAETGHALRELGLEDEAISAYVELVAKSYPISEIGKLLASCFTGKDSLDTLLFAMDAAEIPERIQRDLLLSCVNEHQAQGNLACAKTIFDHILEKKSEYPELSEKLAGFSTTNSDDSRYAFLLESGLLTRDQLKDAKELAEKEEKNLDAVLIETFEIPRGQIAESLKRHYDLPFRFFDQDTAVPHELLKPLKKSFLLENKWVPLSWDLNGVDILIDDPKDLIRTDQAQALMKHSNLRLHVGFAEDIEAFIHLFYDGEKKMEEGGKKDETDIFGFMPEISFEEELYGEVEEEGGDKEENSGEIVRMVDQILISAFRQGASDIHIEPSPIGQKTRIRYRIDGVCQEILELPNSLVRPLVSRIKIMARLDIAERRMPQDGKIKFKRKGIPPFELRVATLPTSGGLEDAVLRILIEADAMPLDKMELNERNLAELEKVIHQPYGLVLVVGPTGSGKTTTLHAALAEINKPGIKIWTAEDPVEISQEGLRQVECHPKIGLNFARIMRAFLRADPDVIMIGEMRDFETASIGIEASLTGHLVFSTLHTNSAPETVTRLLDMGLNPLNFSDSFLGVMAQRLVRRLCTNCRQGFAPKEDELAEMKALYGEDFDDLESFRSGNLKLYKAVGCRECNNTGYKGRMGIHEFLVGSPEVKRLIKRSASTEEIFAQGAKDGMTTLMQDGIRKVLKGYTDLFEVRRVCARLL